MFSSKYSEIYHYTGLAGLKGIWQSQALWATRYDKLNDFTEIKHISPRIELEIFRESEKILNILKAFMPEKYRSIVKNQDPRILAATQARGFVDAVFKTTFEGTEDSPPLTKPYITSFCSHSDGSYEHSNGLSSQWRGYGRNDTSNSGRYAIVFDSSGIESLLKAEDSAFAYVHLGISDVIYANDTRKFEQESHDIMEIAKSALLRASIDDATGFAELLGPYLKVCTRYKHQAFHEENEVRIVACPNMYLFLDERSRNEEEKIQDARLAKPIFGDEDKSSEAKPYISLGGKEKLPIKRIIIGPSRNNTDKISAIREFISSDVRIDISETPFID